MLIDSKSSLWAPPKYFLPLLVLLLSLTCEGSVFIPEQLHCSAQILIRDNISNEQQLGQYLVEEYIDGQKNRSATRLHSQQNGNIEIFYNELPSEEFHIGRKFLAYNINKNQCQSRRIFEWPLSKLRHTLVQLLPIEKLSRKICDIALGPSAILYGLEESLDKMNFLVTKFNQARLADVDIYEHVFDQSTLLSDSQMKKLLLTVQVLSRGQKDLNSSKTLENAASYDGKLDILSVRLCEVQEFNLRDRVAQEEYFCDPKELIYHIEYSIISDLVSGSLAGRGFDPRANLDFGREPFVQPTGIGCWDRDTTLWAQKRLSASSLRMSGEYSTRNGFSGASFVAYDGSKKVLRLDRDAKKSVYDLERGLSYHIDVNPSFYYMGDSKQKRRDEKCIVFEISDKRLRESSVLERLIGIGLPGETMAHYLGTMMVDHRTYHVYETELLFDELTGYNLPILLEPANFVMPSSDERPYKRYFITYYVEEFPGAKSEFTDFIKTIKYMELWENENGARKQLNELEFTQFAWSLDVMRITDSDSQPSNLFYSEACAQERSSQLKIKYRVTQDTNRRQLDDKVIEALRFDKQFIRETFEENLAGLLGISQLNIAHLDAYMTKNPSGYLVWLVEARLVELRSGISEEEMVGYVHFSDIVPDMVISVHHNRHTLDSCKLDSLSIKEPNFLIYCEGLTVCILLADVGGKVTNLMPNVYNKTKLHSNDPSMAACSVYKFDWANRWGSSRAESALARVIDNRREFITGSMSFEFNFGNRQLKLECKTSEAEIIALNPVGGQSSQLAGLRFRTVEEDSRAPFLNIAIELPEDSKRSSFDYCQMSCQLDEFCESFSFCRREKQKHLQDCVLSSMRLTRDRVASLASILATTKTFSDDLELQFELGDESYLAVEQVHQSMARFHRDLDCSVHPKDLSLSYKLVKVFNASGSYGSKPSYAQNLSLDECFGLANEVATYNGQVESNFTFCPVGSLCLIGDPKAIKSELAAGKRCATYAKTHLQFYRRKPSTRVRFRIDNARVDPATDLQKSGLGKFLVGLNAEQCARDCNLAQTKCLAFDSCQPAPKIDVCVLYSARSPEMKSRSTRLGLLEQEKRFYGEDKPTNNSVDLFSAPVCTHFYLKHAYFEIRLRQLQADERKSISTEHPHEPETNKREELEKSLIDADQANGKEELQRDLEEASARRNNSMVVLVVNSDGGHHFLLLSIGLAIGCLCALYSAQALVCLTDLWESHKVKSNRNFREHRISQLELPTNMELQ